MAEYIFYDSEPVEVTDYRGGTHRVYQHEKREEIVRCKDCIHYYEAEEYHPQGNYNRRCCKYFDTYNDEVEPDGFCKWGEKRDASQQ